MCEKSGIVSGRVGNERGIALIIVLMTLLLLSILGVTMLASSTSELKIAGNYRNTEVAFYTAEAALDFAYTFPDIYTSIIPGSATSWPLTGQGKILDEDNFAAGSANSANSNYNRMKIVSPSGVKYDADMKVAFVSTGTVPVGCGTQEDAGLGQGTGFRANNFAVDVIAYGPNNAQAAVESQVAKIVPQL
jgi:Tfp pilus assembly protein PilX